MHSLYSAVDLNLDAPVPTDLSPRYTDLSPRYANLSVLVCLHPDAVDREQARLHPSSERAHEGDALVIAALHRTLLLVQDLDQKLHPSTLVAPFPTAMWSKSIGRAIAGVLGSRRNQP